LSTVVDQGDDVNELPSARSEQPVERRRRATCVGGFKTTSQNVQSNAAVVGSGGPGR
jgi:hypothetical protein